MSKNHGLNLLFFVFIAILFLIISCSNPGQRPARGQLLQTDRDFSALSVREGMYKAFLSYAADSGVLLRDNSYPLVGKSALANLFSGKSDTSFILAWEPLYEKTGSGNDLGYTYGLFTSTVKATGEVSRGTYLTIWEKQADGKWKFVLDTGTQGLPEKSE